MSTRNGTLANGPGKFLRNPGKGYAPLPTAAWYGWGSHVLDGTPWFTYLDIPRMTKDPQVRFILDMLRSPFQQAKFKVHADDQRVAKFVLHTLDKFWRRAVPGILERYFKWGFAPAIISYSRGRKGGIRFHKAQIVEPRDARPLLWTKGPRIGEFAGFQLTPGGGLGVPVENSNEPVTTPHAFWFAGHGRFGKLYDEPRLAGAFTPWLTKNGRGGAEHSTRLWYMKLAFGGGVLKHPEGTTNIGTDDNPKDMDNGDLARLMLENFANGSGLTMPNTPGPGGVGSAWEYVPPGVNGDPRGLLDYTDKLNDAISKGLGWPPEITEASEVGSGWSGRMVPAKAMLDSCDELVNQLVDSADDCFLRELVHQRFGPKAKYEVEPIPLSETVLGQKSAPAPGGPPGGMPPGMPPAAAPGGDGGGAPPAPGGDDALNALFGSKKGGSGQPYRGPRGGRGVKDPRTGRVRYGANLSHGGGDLEAMAEEYAAMILRKLGNKAADLSIGPAPAQRPSPPQEGATLAKLLSLAIIDAHAEGKDDEVDRLVELASHDPEGLRASLEGANLGWVEDGRTPSGKTRWRDEVSREVRYQKSMPGSRAKAHAEGKTTAAKGHAIADKIQAGQATAQDLDDFATHIQAMTVNQLRETRRKIGATFGRDTTRRDAMVAKLRAHVAGKTPAATPTAKPAPAPSASPPPPPPVETPMPEDAATPATPTAAYREFAAQTAAKHLRQWQDKQRVIKEATAETARLKDAAKGYGIDRPSKEDVAKAERLVDWHKKESDRLAAAYHKYKKAATAPPPAAAAPVQQKPAATPTAPTKPEKPK